MKSIDDIRVGNLIALKVKYGSIQKLADALGRSHGQVSQWINRAKNSATGEPRGMKSDTARWIESTLNLQKNWLDTNHMSINIELPNLEVESTLNISTLNIPMLDVYASMGDGYDNHTENVLEVLKVKTHWIERTLRPKSAFDHLRFIHAIGDSMYPTFNDGDILLIDTGETSVTADKIYVLEVHNRLFIKRVRQRIDGTFEISSDNPSIKTVDILNGEHEVNIKGRVIWVWNGKKL